MEDKYVRIWLTFGETQCEISGSRYHGRVVEINALALDTRILCNIWLVNCAISGSRYLCKIYIVKM